MNLSHFLFLWYGGKCLFYFIFYSPPSGSQGQIQGRNLEAGTDWHGGMLLIDLRPEPAGMRVLHDKVLKGRTRDEEIEKTRSWNKEVLHKQVTHAYAGLVSTVSYMSFIGEKWAEVSRKWTKQRWQRIRHSCLRTEPQPFGGESQIPTFVRSAPGQGQRAKVPFVFYQNLWESLGMVCLPTGLLPMAFIQSRDCATHSGLGLYVKFLFPLVL